MIDRLRKASDNLIGLLLFESGDQNNTFLILHFVHDADDLIGTFSLPENNFRKPLAQRTVMINMRVFNIFVANVTQFDGCIFNRQTALCHRF